MKKIILSICIILAAVTFASAQGGAAKRKAEITQGLKEEVKLTDAQIASVLAIEAEFKPKMSAIKADQTLDEVGKKEKTKAVRLEKTKKMEAELGNETAKKVEDFYSKLKKKKPADEKKEK
ncbi:hypothetical protein [Pedobacter heparinus]|uniref:LTXXQ motif protein n=1 Tax=Pedobacter heparinus (strain ATCC 13125 / DSM 2366 / CIP 104194 / JCM 7457 / NBRC 12017 / NCIMB 9290 / NRRL B-14731 / HIM 762-3) TaxID=485917 RepID=C6Y336_PEDHD|nr:hypothetical protein [Pedobacter heparinus]ACU03249.1 hypothetical protein Phep_1028 [Pedobacter heparinus DSM 2366]